MMTSLEFAQKQAYRCSQLGADYHLFFVTNGDKTRCKGWRLVYESERRDEDMLHTILAQLDAGAVNGTFVVPCLYKDRHKIIDALTATDVQ